MTQQQLAMLSGVRESQISKFERGNTRIWPDAQRKLAEALDMTIEDLFPEFQKTN